MGYLLIGKGKRGGPKRKVNPSKKPSRGRVPAPLEILRLRHSERLDGGGGPLFTIEKKVQLLPMANGGPGKSVLSSCPGVKWKREKRGICLFQQKGGTLS